MRITARSGGTAGSRHRSARPVTLADDMVDASRHPHATNPRHSLDSFSSGSQRAIRTWSFKGATSTNCSAIDSPARAGNQFGIPRRPRPDQIARRRRAATSEVPPRPWCRASVARPARGRSLLDSGLLHAASGLPAASSSFIAFISPLRSRADWPTLFASAGSLAAPKSRRMTRRRMTRCQPVRPWNMSPPWAT